MRLQHSRRGFTLIELLVVVVIIGILASIGVGGYNAAMDRARNGGVTSNVRSVLLGIEQWKTDHTGLPKELVGASHDDALASNSTGPGDFPVKYVSGGHLPPGPWGKASQIAMDSTYNASGGNTLTSGGSCCGAFVPGLNDPSLFTTDDDGGYTDIAPPTGMPPPPNDGPSARTHYGYMYYCGEVGSGRYMVLGIGKSKKLAKCIAVRTNFN